ncbi:hypothetical protein J0895_16295 [Phormidium pseudopriestleyi FRX01]|uniref:Uncharacterized protein n=1 Tax=Phormidium pseudopriestleyi FRX01 TaxID=1759528 RepID=A0ABS3FUU3_9CYAN|nr:hypothetical protein [Phormidium pseudopriestleyi]MBO0350627.1 hypothetical protein [Phormidium pseudopriestleyi FRX01]
MKQRLSVIKFTTLTGLGFIGLSVPGLGSGVGDVMKRSPSRMMHQPRPKSSKIIAIALNCRKNLQIRGRSPVG